MINKRRGNLCKLNKRLLASSHKVGAAGLLTSSHTDQHIATKEPQKSTELARHGASDPGQ
jgi:hypothetical protein